MSQPPGPGQQPGFERPNPYGGYGGYLQGHGQQQPPHQPQPYQQQPYQQQPYAHPPAQPPTRPAVELPPQRPAAITFAATMTVTASMLWVCGLGFVWLMAIAALDQFDTAVQTEAVFYHMANRLHLRLLTGLAWPLFLFPTVAVVAGFMLLSRANWTRIFFTLLGVASIGWTLWWQSNDLAQALPAVVYIGFCVVMVWTPSAGRWFRWKAVQNR